MKNKLRSFIVTTVILAAASIASASASASASTISSSKQEMCTTLSAIAERIMYLRQEGTDMMELVRVTTVPIAMKMIEQAYEQPQYSTDEYKQRAVQRFKNEWALACIKAKV